MASKIQISFCAVKRWNFCFPTKYFPKEGIGQEGYMPSNCFFISHLCLFLLISLDSYSIVMTKHHDANSMRVNILLSIWQFGILDLGLTSLEFTRWSGQAIFWGCQFVNFITFSGWKCYPRNIWRMSEKSMKSGW